MPKAKSPGKAKSHSGASKRFRITGTGKLMRRRANRNHLLEHKSSRRTRRLYNEVELSSSDNSRMKKLMGRCSAPDQRPLLTRGGLESSPRRTSSDPFSA